MSSKKHRMKIKRYHQRAKAHEAFKNDLVEELLFINLHTSALMYAVNKVNCKSTLDLNADRIKYFKDRIAIRMLPANEVVIVVVSVDDVHGKYVADGIMPNFNWQEIRDRNEVPIARGIYDRKVIQQMLDIIDEDASKKLKNMTDIAVVVVDYGVAEVFTA